MFRFSRPSLDDLDRFRASQANHAFTYPEVGATRDRLPDAGYAIDRNRVQIGRGAEDYRKACAAMRAWTMFPPGWTHIHPPASPIEPGTTIVMLGHIFGLWWPNACRIVYVLDEREPHPRFGFAYGTLPGHVECGEERFLVEWCSDDTVWYELTAFSRPRAWFVRLAAPVGRRIQKRFARESLASMKHALVRGDQGPDVESR